MGRLTYEGHVHTEMDDRALAHVQMVIANKLRRGEPFFFTWKDDAASGQGRTAVWIHPGCNLVFAFRGSGRPPLNRTWLEALNQLANTPGGLRMIPEPVSTADPRDDALSP